MAKIDKMSYQKRALAIQNLCELFELYPKLRLGEILSTLVSPIGESKHPYYWTDNEFMGKVESVKTILSEDYNLDYIQEYEQDTTEA